MTSNPHPTPFIGSVDLGNSAAEIDRNSGGLIERYTNLPTRHDKASGDNNAGAHEKQQEFAPPPYDFSYREASTVDHRTDMKIPATSPNTMSTTSSPTLHIVIQVVGLRDDVSTFIAVGIILKSYGHRVRIATHPVFCPLVISHGLEFFDIGGNPGLLMRQMLQCSDIFPNIANMASGRLRDLRRDVRHVMDDCWRSCFHNTSQDARTEPFIADLIIANPSSHAHIHCAQKLGIPVHLLSTTPSSSILSLVQPLTSVNPDLNSSIPDYASFMLTDMAIWQSLGGIVNNFRRKTLALEAMDTIWTPATIARLKIPHIYCWPSRLSPKFENCPSHITFSAYSFLPRAETTYTPSSAFAAFLSSADTLVYINFDPISLHDSTVLENLVFEAVRLARVRAVVCLGKRTPGASSQLPVAENIFLVDDMPRDWIFPQVSCVVHGGASEVTAAALRLGKPSVTVPFFGDQSFMGDVLALSGLGPKPIPFGHLTSANLAQSIQEALQSVCLSKVRALADHINSENGAEIAAQNIISQLPLPRMACNISDNRISVWRHKKYPHIKLSALAAVVLEDEGLLTMSDLFLDRSIQYNLDSGPWEPVSGATSAIAGLFYDTFHGMGEILYDIASTAGTIHRLSNNLVDDQCREGETDNAPSDCTSMKTRIPGHRALKGTSRIFKAAARAPMTFTYALAQGSHNMPHLWGDQLIRPQQEIRGIWSGLAAGAKELFFGTYDGIAGLIEHPIVGAKREGPKGFAKGVCHGVLGLPTRWFAAMSGTVGYPLKGIDAEIVRMIRKDPLKDVIAARTQQGMIQLQRISLVERYAIVNKWKVTVAKAD